MLLMPSCMLFPETVSFVLNAALLIPAGNRKFPVGGLVDEPADGLAVELNTCATSLLLSVDELAVALAVDLNTA